MMKRNSVKFSGLLISQPLLLTLLLVGLLIWGLQAPPVYAATINVDDDLGGDSSTCGETSSPCRTIPYALTYRAGAGDTVSVWAGTYTETFTLRAGIVISGAGATRTFIDGEGVRGPMVSASGSAIGSSTVLRGVTIRRGTTMFNGGGVYIINGAAPLIEDCVVSENTATSGTSNGGGLYVSGAATLTLRDTQVLSNTAYYRGGGMYKTGGSLNLFECRFENNVATTNHGGGLWIDRTVVMTETAFVDNRAGGNGGGIFQSGPTWRVELIGGRLEDNSALIGAYNGGGLYAQGTAVLSSTQVTGNRAAQWGGGVWANYMQVTDALITDNFAGQRGGGLYAVYSVAMTATSMISNTAPQQGGGVGALGAVDIVNSLFARNSAGAGSAVWMSSEIAVQNQLQHLTIVSPTVSSAYPNAAAILARGQATAMVTNTIVSGYPYAIEAFQGSTVYEDYNLYYNLGTGFFNENGGLVYNGGHSLYHLNPHFVNPATDDYHIDDASAALDAGSFGLGVTTDFDGDSRPTNTAQPDAPDIGFDENRDTTITRAITDTTDTMTFGAVCARIVFTNTGSLTGITVARVDSSPSGLANPLSHYYTITPEGSGPYTATLSVCYTDDEVIAANVVEGSLELHRFDGASWNAYSSTVDISGNVVTATEVVTFSDWALAGDPPTMVDVASFTATPAAGAILLEWETAAEIDNVGFNLYRLDDILGELVRLNENLIPSLSPGSVMGAQYQWLDQEVELGIHYRYWLEAVDVHGVTTRYESMSVMLARDALYVIYLPLVIR